MSYSFTEPFHKPIPHQLWTHEYEPHELNQIVGNPMIIETLQSFLKNHDLPNLLLCGPHGCGKTCMAKLLIRAYLGTDNPLYQMTIDGSIYRGKNVVSEKVDKKKTADSSLNGPNIIRYIRKKINLPNKLCRVITIYDFECMTTEAQMALRRIIEIYSQRVRFIFICNNLNKIIEAIQSRTLILKCQPISLEDITSRLKMIADHRNLEISEEIFNSIGIMVQGDLRQAINYLQVFSRSPELNVTSFYHLFNIPSIRTINQIIKECCQGRAIHAIEIIDQLIESGYNVTDILDILIKVLVYQQELSEGDRVSLLEETIRSVCRNEQSSSIVHLNQLMIRIQDRFVSKSQLKLN